MLSADKRELFLLYIFSEISLQMQRHTLRPGYSKGTDVISEAQTTK